MKRGVVEIVNRVGGFVMYKMKCPRCGEEMKYTKNEEMEKLGVIGMDCVNNGEGGYLGPINKPDLRCEE